jgi:hypothetical protein
MANGPFDSSLTRVQPVMNQLYGRDTTGHQWLLPLLALGSRSSEVKLQAADGWTGKITKPPAFEFEALSPPAYLKYLVLNPNRMAWPMVGGRRKPFQEETTRNREALFEGNAAARQAAVQDLDRSRLQGNWWVFEGTTCVDCALFAERVTVFVEGKRTEPALTDKIEWDPLRRQVCRILDCLQALEDRADRYFVLLIVEQGTPLCGKAAEFDRDFDGARNSWPHLEEEKARELWEHYLGYTTWQQIHDEFGDWDIQLPNTVEQALQAGLAHH